MDDNGMDPILNAYAVVELVQHLGSAEPLVTYCTLVEDVRCGHQLGVLTLADALVRVSRQTEFDLQAFVDAERARALAAATDEPGMSGMA
jgi:hypothetical protein